MDSSDRNTWCTAGAVMFKMLELPAELVHSHQRPQEPSVGPLSLATVTCTAFLT